MSFFHCKYGVPINMSLTPGASRSLVQAFVSSRLDHCNIGFDSQLLNKLQVIQNAAARFITGARKFDHMTPVLR